MKTTTSIVSNSQSETASTPAAPQAHTPAANALQPQRCRKQAAASPLPMSAAHAHTAGCHRSRRCRFPRHGAARMQSCCRLPRLLHCYRRCRAQRLPLGGGREAGAKRHAAPVRAAHSLHLDCAISGHCQPVERELQAGGVGRRSRFAGASMRGSRRRSDLQGTGSAVSGAGQLCTGMQQTARTVDPQQAPGAVSLTLSTSYSAAGPEPRVRAPLDTRSCFSARTMALKDEPVFTW